MIAMKVPTAWYLTALLVETYKRHSLSMRVLVKSKSLGTWTEKTLISLYLEFGLKTVRSFDELIDRKIKAKIIN